MVDYLKRTWAQVDLDAIALNLKNIKEVLSPKCVMMAVVKADAYGHGDRFVAKKLQEEGITWFGVSNIEEAVSLRRAGVDKEILILGPTPRGKAALLLKEKLTQTVHSLEYAQMLSEAAVQSGGTVRVHIKADTGMNRLGILAADSSCDEAIDAIAEITSLPNLDCEGIFTHFSVADELDEASKEYTVMQYERFCELLDLLKMRGITFKIRHCCNSAATLNYPQFHMDMVRCGIILYGLYPTLAMKLNPKVELVPSMSLKTTVSSVKLVDKESCISYGRKYITTKPTKVAAVAIGYADGYSRIFSSKARMLVGGAFADILGSICMDQLMLDVTDIEGVKRGDIVTVFGKDGIRQVSVDELAVIAGTISYEIICLIGRRVPRVYSLGGRDIAVVDYIIKG